MNADHQTKRRGLAKTLVALSLGMMTAGLMASSPNQVRADTVDLGFVSCGADGKCGTAGDKPGPEGSLIGALNLDKNGPNVTGSTAFASKAAINALAAVPEPTTLALLGSGLVAAGILGRKWLFKSRRGE